MSEGSWRRIRPVALGIVRRERELLVFAGRDGGERFYRPLGGGVEFGETSEEALGREFREELDVQINIGERLDVLERAFEFDGRRCHEISFLYEVDVVEDWPYERDEFAGTEDDGSTFRSVWKSVDDFENGDALYPEGLLQHL